MRGYAVVLGAAFATTFLLTPLVRWLAVRIGAIAMPGPRNVHTRPTPLLGGGAMFAGFLVAMVVASRMDQFSEMFDGSSEPLGLILAAGVMFVVGMLDDLREVSPPAKLAGQVLSGGILSLMGVTMLYLRVPFANENDIVLSADLAPIVTVLAVVLFANAINLIDGLDGLAAGITAIAGLALFLYADRLFKNGLLEGSNIGPLVAIIAVGVCLGFLPFNFSPARIFMGDAGALFLGLLMATTTITVGGRTVEQFPGQTYFFFAPLVIPLVILGVPIVDTVFSFVRRIVKGSSPATADSDHLHHRLMRLGHGPRRTVVILWLWTALLSGLALLPTYRNRFNAWVPLALVASVLLLFSYFHPGARTAREEARVAAGTPPPDGGAEAEAEMPATAEGSEPAAQVVDLEERRRAGGRGSA